MSKEIIEGLDSAIEAIRQGKEMLSFLPFTPEELKAYREKRNISQDTLARELDVSVSTVQSWEMGRRQPRDKMLEKLREMAYT